MQNTPLRVTIVQNDLVWENKTVNLDSFTQILLKSQGKTDLIVLPEMFTTGFTMQASLFAENAANSQTLNWLQNTAQQTDAAIIASFIIEENNKYYNRLFFVRPDESFETYDKRHLFALGGEHGVYTAGSEKLVVNWRNWRIMPLICYDLRFPTWSRNTMDYDLLVYIANWPERRRAHWRTLLMARAIENQCYTVGVNRVGVDNWGLNHSGNSIILNAFGEIVAEIVGDIKVFHCTLSKDELVDIREKLPFLKDRD